MGAMDRATPTPEDATITASHSAGQNARPGPPLASKGVGTPSTALVRTSAFYESNIGDLVCVSGPACPHPLPLPFPRHPCPAPLPGKEPLALGGGSLPWRQALEPPALGPRPPVSRPMGRRCPVVPCSLRDGAKACPAPALTPDLPPSLTSCPFRSVSGYLHRLFISFIYFFFSVFFSSVGFSLWVAGCPDLGDQDQHPRPHRHLRAVDLCFQNSGRHPR